ncbi:MAG: hypothetical protein FJX76_12135, partial [Armatimonadetes bacterium]|nr:hypothetical protein [Armatimonadota bacterium]
LVFGYLFYLWSQTSLGKITLERWSLRLPLYGRQIRYRMMSRFLRSSATLMNSGVPLGMAFAVLEQSLDRELLRVTVRMQADAASHGLPIAYGMQTVGLFPPMVLEMVVVAEETGTLPRTLERLASFYDQEMAIGLTDITKFIEVAVVMLLGGAVAVLLLAAFMPIYQLTASF